MKIGSFGNVFRISSSVGSKRNEGDGGTGGNFYERQQGGQNERHQERHGEPSDPEKDGQRMADAVAAFQADTSMQAHGLSAVIEGAGPGLTVAVKDVNGTTVRQFSREEFLRMREGTSRDARSRGKILDQKL